MNVKAIVSSDWNECLAPCGPFDAIIHAHPELGPRLAKLFRDYTGNRASLSETARIIETLLPETLRQEQMDAYLGGSFATYPGVPGLMQWCAQNDVLFMINTTGMAGYFQRAIRKGLLPKPPVISAHPLIRYDDAIPGLTFLPLHETSDKGRNTEAVARRFGVPASRIAVMGDSGGDGPHFQWAASIGAFRVSCMAKPSLIAFCDAEKITIHHRFGPSEETTQAIDFTNLIPVLQKMLQM